MPEDVCSRSIGAKKARKMYPIASTKKSRFGVLVGMRNYFRPGPSGGISLLEPRRIAEVQYIKTESINLANAFRAAGRALEIAAPMAAQVRRNPRRILLSIQCAESRPFRFAPKAKAALVPLARRPLGLVQSPRAAR